jgi:hypothetical protein
MNAAEHRLGVRAREYARACQAAFTHDKNLCDIQPR